MSGHVRRRLVDFALYLTIAGVLFAAVIVYASNSHSGAADHISRWGGLLAHTLTLYGCIIMACKDSWRLWAFWIPLSLLLSAHLLLFSLLLLMLDEWKSVWFLVIYPMETPLILLACDWSLGRFASKKKT
jgi:hypothetical protein